MSEIMSKIKNAITPKKNAEVEVADENKVSRRDLTFTSLAFGAAAVMPTSAALAQAAKAPAAGTPKGFQPGRTMPAEYYLDPKWYDRDERYLAENYWWLVDHETRIPKAGDFFLFQFGRGESVIIARDDKGVVNAMHNVCQHRGSRLCIHDEERPTEALPGGKAPDANYSIKQLGQEGNTSVFRCPYHAWTFDLNGKLVSVPGPNIANPDGFKMEENGLHHAHVRVVDGFIFVSLAEGKAPEMTLPEGNFIHPKMKIATRHVIPTKANWKLVLENFVECYHCQPAHNKSYTTAVWKGDLTLSKAQFEKIAEDAKKLGKDYGTYEQWVTNRGRATTPLNEASYPPMTQIGSSGGTGYDGPGRGQDLRPGWVSHTIDGKPAVSKLLDGAESGHNLGAHVGGMRRGMNGIIYHGDYATIYRFTPRGPDLTDVELIWLVHPDAVEGKDYNSEHVAAFWYNTCREDAWVAENNHTGLKSHYGYSRGGKGQTYMKVETGPAGFINWYLAEMVPSMLQAEAKLETKKA